MKNLDIYKKVTDKLMNLIESDGLLPWQKTWKYKAGQLPCNYASKRPYRGINLLMAAYDQFSSPYYLTKKEILKRGGSWKGKGTLIVFWNFQNVEIEGQINPVTGKNAVVSQCKGMRYYYVWNEEQITGIDFKHPKVESLNEFENIETVEDILVNMPNKPQIVHAEQDKAYYSPSEDKVVMPLKGQFKSIESYYSVFSHELIHSTGHRKRLGREGVIKPTMFGSHEYSKEELVAEMGASFIMGLAGIEQSTIKNSASYLKGWMSKIKSDPSLLSTAANQAQKAVDYILGQSPKGEVKENEKQSTEALAV